MVYIEIKDHAKVKYLGCILDESLSGESIALNIIVRDRYLQFIVSDIFRFYNNQCPDYFNEDFGSIDNN